VIHKGKVSTVKHNAANERIKHRYLAHQRGPMQLDEQSLDAIAAALDRFEDHTGRRDFKTFRPEQADAFQRALLKQRNARTGGPLTKGTIVSILRALKAFFWWLADQPGYRSRLRHDWANHFNPSLKAIEVARTRREPHVPTVEQIHDTIATMPTSTPIEMRNRAVVAFTLLSGSRDAAIASLRLRHVNLGARVVYLDGRDVRTKFAKTTNAAFFPVGGNAEAIVRDWIAFLTGELGFGPDDPLFPATRTGFGSDGRPLSPTLSRDCWSSGEPIRAIFKAAFAAAGLSYFKPHSFRHTLARLATTKCDTIEELKAWSQNLSHADVLTTLTSYGQVPFHRQRDLILACGDRDEDTEELIRLGRAVRAVTGRT
jgi:integrase